MNSKRNGTAIRNSSSSSRTAAAGGFMLLSRLIGAALTLALLLDIVVIDMHDLVVMVSAQPNLVAEHFPQDTIINTAGGGYAIRAEERIRGSTRSPFPNKPKWHDLTTTGAICYTARGSKAYFSVDGAAELMARQHNLTFGGSGGPDEVGDLIVDRFLFQHDSVQLNCGEGPDVNFGCPGNGGMFYAEAIGTEASRKAIIPHPDQPYVNWTNPRYKYNWSPNYAIYEFFSTPEAGGTKEQKIDATNLTVFTAVPKKLRRKTHYHASFLEFYPRNNKGGVCVNISAYGVWTGRPDVVDKDEVATATAPDATGQPPSPSASSSSSSFPPPHYHLISSNVCYAANRSFHGQINFTQSVYLVGFHVEYVSGSVVDANGARLKMGDTDTFREVFSFAANGSLFLPRLDADGGRDPNTKILGRLSARNEKYFFYTQRSNVGSNANQSSFSVFIDENGMTFERDEVMEEGNGNGVVFERGDTSLRLEFSDAPSTAQGRSGSTCVDVYAIGKKLPGGGQGLTTTSSSNVSGGGSSSAQTPPPPPLQTIATNVCFDSAPTSDSYPDWGHMVFNKTIDHVIGVRIERKEGSIQCSSSRAQPAPWGCKGGGGLTGMDLLITEGAFDKSKDGGRGNMVVPSTEDTNITILSYYAMYVFRDKPEVDIVTRMKDPVIELFFTFRGSRGVGKTIPKGTEWHMYTSDVYGGMTGGWTADNSGHICVDVFAIQDPHEVQAGAKQAADAEHQAMIAKMMTPPNESISPLPEKWNTTTSNFTEVCYTANTDLENGFGQIYFAFPSMLVYAVEIEHVSGGIDCIGLGETVPERSRFGCGSHNFLEYITSSDRRNILFPDLSIVRDGSSVARLTGGDPTIASNSTWKIPRIEYKKLARSATASGQPPPPSPSPSSSSSSFLSTNASRLVLFSRATKPPLVRQGTFLYLWHAASKSLLVTDKILSTPSTASLASLSTAKGTHCVKVRFFGVNITDNYRSMLDAEGAQTEHSRTETESNENSPSATESKSMELQTPPPPTATTTKTLPAMDNNTAGLQPTAPPPTTLAATDTQEESTLLPTSTEATAATPPPTTFESINTTLPPTPTPNVTETDTPKKQPHEVENVNSVLLTIMGSKEAAEASGGSGSVASVAVGTVSPASATQVQKIGAALRTVECGLNSDGSGEGEEKPSFLEHPYSPPIGSDPMFRHSTGGVVVSSCILIATQLVTIIAHQQASSSSSDNRRNKSSSSSSSSSGGGSTTADGQEDCDLYKRLLKVDNAFDTSSSDDDATTARLSSRAPTGKATARKQQRERKKQAQLKHSRKQKLKEQLILQSMQSSSASSSPQSTASKVLSAMSSLNIAVLCFLGPNILSTSTTLVLHGNAAAKIIGLAMSGLVCLVLFLLGKALNRKDFLEQVVVVPVGGETQSNSKKSPVGDEKSSTPPPLKLEFLNGHRCSGFVERFSPAFDAAKTVDRKLCRNVLLVELSVAASIGLLAGLRLDRFCGEISIGITCVSIAHVGYLLKVRPYRTKLDTVFITGFALNQAALGLLCTIAALSGGGSSSPYFAAAGYCALAQLWSLVVQCVVQVVWAWVTRERKQALTAQRREFLLRAGNELGDGREDSSSTNARQVLRVPDGHQSMQQPHVVSSNPLLAEETSSKSESTSSASSSSSSSGF